VEIVLMNQPGWRAELLAALDDFARQHRLAESVRQAADLSLEEHLTNILRYGYSDAERHEIRVRFELEEGCLAIEIEDDGQAFDPLAVPEPDTTAPLEGRPVGGLGIHLIRRFMDEVQYRREADRNILHLRKRLRG
jgi:anti-sigma regulatory factor (Ser/Thr protein kinase)